VIRDEIVIAWLSYMDDVYVVAYRNETTLGEWEELVMTLK